MFQREIGKLSFQISYVIAKKNKNKSIEKNFYFGFRLF